MLFEQVTRQVTIPGTPNDGVTVKHTEFEDLLIEVRP